MPKELYPEDIAKVVDSLPSEVYRILQTLRIYLAGGYIRAIINDEKPKDIDLFVKSSHDASLGSAILRDTYGYSVYKTPNAITCSKAGCKKVQFITRWSYESPKDMIDSFDFTIAMAGIWYTHISCTWQSICHEDYYHDVLEKQLVYLKPDRDEEKAGSLLRMLKFISKGYTISDGELAKVIARFAVCEGFATPTRVYEELLAVSLYDRLTEVRTISKGDYNDMY